MTEPISLQAAHLKKQQKALDDQAAAIAGQHNLWGELLPRVAYTPGRLTNAVIELLEGRRHGAAAARS